MNILHALKVCPNKQEYCTHAGHDHSKNITEITKK